MAEALGVPQSTAYRTVRDLVKASLLEHAAGSRYRLGVAFLEYDRTIRLTDPLLQRGQPILRELVQQTGLPCVGLLSRLYANTVMCVAIESAGAPSFRSSYERGRPMPLLRGATSKVILAQLPARRLRQFLARQGDEDQSAIERAELLSIRRRGHAITRGEIDPGLAGIAVPVSSHLPDLIASLSLVLHGADVDQAAERRLLLRLTTAAGLLADALNDTNAPLMVPAVLAV